MMGIGLRDRFLQDPVLDLQRWITTEKQRMVGVV